MTLGQEDEDLSLQREKLKKRHLPGGEDSIGDDPLSSPLGDSAASSPCSSFQCEGPVRLELGMDAEVLDKVLAELEVSLHCTECMFICMYPSVAW